MSTGPDQSVYHFQAVRKRSGSTLSTWRAQGGQCRNLSDP